MQFICIAIEGGESEQNIESMSWFPTPHYFWWGSKVEISNEC